MGHGTCIYLASEADDALLQRILDGYLKRAGILPCYDRIEDLEAVELTYRNTDTREAEQIMMLLLNHNDCAVTLPNKVFDLVTQKDKDIIDPKDLVLYFKE